jgi:hypothetical protein
MKGDELNSRHDKQEVRHPTRSGEEDSRLCWPVRLIHDDTCASATDPCKGKWKTTSDASSRSGEEDSPPAGRWQWRRVLPPKPPRHWYASRPRPRPLPRPLPRQSPKSQVTHAPPHADCDGGLLLIGTSFRGKDTNTVSILKRGKRPWWMNG